MDTSNVSQYIPKIKRLLENALKPNFSLNLNLLLSHFCREENEEIIDAVINLDLFTKWIIEACTFWEEHEDVPPSTNMTCFVLELTSILSKNEERFQQLSSQNIYLKLCDIFRVRRYNCASEIKLAYIKLLESFLEHKDGVEWIKATNSWVDVLNCCLEANVIKESYNFMYKLLENRASYDEVLCNNVAKRIIQPLNLKNSIKNNEPLNNQEIEELQLKSKITPTLQLITVILENYLKNEWNLKRYTHIPRSFIMNCNLLQIIDSYILFVKDQDLSYDLGNIAYLIHFISLCIDSKEYMITEQESIPVFEKIFFLLEAAINRRQWLSIAKLSHIALSYCSLIQKRLLPLTYKDINKDPSLMQIQLVLMQTMPISQFFENNFKIDWHIDDLDVIRDYCMQGIYRKVNEYTLRLLYIYKKKMTGNHTPTYKSLTIDINYMLKSRKYYNNEAAIILFQTMLYVLHDVIEMAKSDTIEIQMAVREPDFFMAIVCLVRELIESFDIKWTVCMESVCVVNTVLNFLLFTIWPVKLTIEALKLLKLSIKKYMSPNLVLLVDRTSDSSLGQLGPLLRSKLAEEHWEIRDHSLQVLITISELSHKFPSLQDLLQQENFPPLALKLCESDPECFVRASALKCLQHMVKSDVLWNDFFEHQELPDKVLQILSKETNGIVRLEAVALINFLYISQCYGEEKIPKIYEIMTVAATVDLHWEVRTKALEFWDKIIWECLRDQGTIDGNFPEVTFSKQAKKIIVLNSDEIKKRLNKVLNELKRNGCLHILTKSIQEDLDIEVVEQAVEIAKKFVSLLKKYNMVSFVDSNSICQYRVKHDDFFELIRYDLDRVVENRRRWLKKADHFETLLNDMLRDIEEDESMNTMDCY